MPHAANRNRLAKVLRGTDSELVTVGHAAGALGLDRITAAKQLARWQDQGRLRRVRRGVYAPVPLTADVGDQIIEDPWTLVPELFGPAYIGGLSAAHHWDLTEQLFRTVFVYTARLVRQTTQTIQGIPFALHHVQPMRLSFGLSTLWRGQLKLQVSDVHRTVTDMLDYPAAGGGIRHVADCLDAYLVRPDADPKKLVEYTEHLDNGAVFKRLGFLAEYSESSPWLIEACIERLTQGYAKLDPAMPCPRVSRRWRLRLPEAWAGRKVASRPAHRADG